MHDLARSTVALPSLREYRPRNRRRILLVFPKYAYSFGTFQHAFPLMGDVKGFMPPQGILLIAALLPKEWEYRFIDENVQAATAEDFDWADAVFTSGMHIQRERIREIIARAHSAGKVAVLGGPSVSSAPEYYPEADLLHLGEAGDATVRLFMQLDETTARPESPIHFRTLDRLPLAEFPSPAYRRIRVRDYLLGSVQFSSGCPFTCEFCDIPALYGRNPRLKSPEQIIRELDQLADGGAVSVYFVDDNFVGNPKAAQELIPHLIQWQRRRDFQVRLSCEATLNMVKYPELLEGMRQAFFTNVFMGIETPEPHALKAMRKVQNLRSPILDAVRTMNAYGMEVAAGIIMGLDTDTHETSQAIIDFASASEIPILTVNILYALPRTALYERLEKAGRILSEADSAGHDSNIQFLIPYEEVVRRWRRVISAVYDPAALYRRYAYNAVHTYPRRVGPTQPLRHATWPNLRRAAHIFSRLIWTCGIRGPYRSEFWKMALRELGRGNIETMFQVAMVAHHLITYAQECQAGLLQASNYSIRDASTSSPPRTIEPSDNAPLPGYG
jgi:radical SAM superfamily enzyme YgiQ (UPF0313 family)